MELVQLIPNIYFNFFKCSSVIKNTCRYEFPRYRFSIVYFPFKYQKSIPLNIKFHFISLSSIKLNATLKDTLLNLKV